MSSAPAPASAKHATLTSTVSLSLAFHYDNSTAIPFRGQLQGPRSHGTNQHEHTAYKSTQVSLFEATLPSRCLPAPEGTELPRLICSAAPGEAAPPCAAQLQARQPVLAQRPPVPAEGCHAMTIWHSPSTVTCSRTHRLSEKQLVGPL